MAYQVWIKDAFEGWKMIPCEDTQGARAELTKALLGGKDPLLTVAIPYQFNVEIKEEKTVEVDKSEAEPGKGAGAEGES